MIIKLKYWTIAVGVVALFASAQASAALIDFEDAGTRGLTDNTELTTQYSADFGVTFHGGYLEKAGSLDGDPQGFGSLGIADSDGDGNTKDDAANSAAEAELGTWFLRTGGDLAGRGPGDAFLSITYDTAVSMASGQIWDIDGAQELGSEKWIVNALDSNGDVVATATSPEHSDDTLNGLPWAFGLDAGSNLIVELQFVFDGSKTEGIGLAFDNFNTNSLLTPVPAPSVVWLFGIGLGLLGLGAGLRRRKHTGGDLAA